ncbi:hypothetical protein AB1K62_14310 [Parasphingorhabdus sp. JC815]|uniref:hypothetical protein n=1 Tax=Parasphingorhabdus sp. JC815 TaxID=3232140 RepID=UPI0034573E81
MTMTPQEHQDLLDAYNASQGQLEADRQALEDKTATDIAATCAAFDVTGLIAALEAVDAMCLATGKHKQVLSSTIGVAKLLNNVTAPVPVEPEPEV